MAESKREMFTCMRFVTMCVCVEGKHIFQPVYLCMHVPLEFENKGKECTFRCMGIEQKQYVCMRQRDKMLVNGDM